MSYILFDVGANHGQDSLNQTKDNPDVITYAFEPIPELYEKLKAASQRGVSWEFYRRTESPGFNYSDRYHAYNCAVSDYDGTSTFNVADSDRNGDWGASSLYDFVPHVHQTWPGRHDLVTNRKITVEVCRLDTWFKNNNIQLDRIDYFHCDTQGSDLRVLKGMGDYIQLIQAGVVECARDEQGKLYAENHTKDEMAEFLYSRGFEVIGLNANDPWANEFNLHFKKR